MGVHLSMFISLFTAAPLYSIHRSGLPASSAFMDQYRQCTEYLLREQERESLSFNTAGLICLKHSKIGSAKEKQDFLNHFFFELFEVQCDTLACMCVRLMYNAHCDGVSLKKCKSEQRPALCVHKACCVFET